MSALNTTKANVTYFGFAIADSMFPDSCSLIKRSMPLDSALLKGEIENAIPCLNPSHVATIQAMQERYGISIEIPEKPPVVNLNFGDKLIVMGVRGLPRLTDRHEYASIEIEAATFKFSLYEVVQGEE